MITHEFNTTTDWLAARRSMGIGSSDAPAILGLTPWRSPLAVFHEKRGTLGREIEPKYAEMAGWGLALEDVIAKRYALKTGRIIIKPPKLTIAQHPTVAYMVASVDRYADVPLVDLGEAPKHGREYETERIVVELKNAHWFSKEKWEDVDEGIAEPPLEYVVQLQHQLAVTDRPWGSLAVLIGGVEFRYADIKRHDGFIAQLMDLEAEFWGKVQRGEEPEADGSDATTSLLRELYPKDTGATIELPPEALDWAAELGTTKAEIKRLEEVKILNENRLKQALGDATMGTLRDGTAFTYKLQERKEFISKATSFRVLRQKK